MSKIEMLCKECKKPQTPNKTKSNKYWGVYDLKQKCECGGRYTMHIDGRALGE